jgi:Protein of unknown function (DUF4242)
MGSRAVSCAGHPKIGNFSPCPAAHRGRTLTGTAEPTAEQINEQEKFMKRYVIEREIPGASELSEAELAEIAGKSNDVVESLGVPYRWITSYVAGDKIYCIHEADDEDAIREHARRGGFPANSVTVVANEFGPDTATVT